MGDPRVQRRAKLVGSRRRWPGSPNPGRRALFRDEPRIHSDGDGCRAQAGPVELIDRCKTPTDREDLAVEARSKQFRDRQVSSGQEGGMTGEHHASMTAIDRCIPALRRLVQSGRVLVLERAEPCLASIESLLSLGDLLGVAPGLGFGELALELRNCFGQLIEESV